MNTITKNRLLAPMNLLYKISPEMDLKILYKLKTGHTLHLDNLVTFTEKIQWIKLYEKNPLMTICADKFLVRDYVKSRGCGEQLNELLWEGFDPKDIPFDDLPDAFAIKVTHGSGFNIICHNKKDLDCDKARKLLKKWLKVKFLPCYGEWFYGVEKPRIIIEKYIMTKPNEILLDYKFYCFHGEPRLIYAMIIEDKNTGNVYDLDFNFIPNVKLGVDADLRVDVPKPDNLEEMLEYARKLSKDFLHVRVDFYSVNGKVIFGELSFTKSAGFSKISPYAFDIEMGNWLTLPVLDEVRWNRHLLIGMYGILPTLDKVQQNLHILIGAFCTLHHMPYF